MPPPKRRIKREARPAMSTYPPYRVGITLGGYRSIPFTQAIRCWAQLMEPATVTVAEQFSAKEWNYMARACHDVEREFDPENHKPGDLIAQRVEKAANYGIAAELLDRAKGLALAEKLRELDYLHAWAVIWSLQWRRDCGDELKANEAWWTLAHRQARMGDEQ